MPHDAKPHCLKAWVAVQSPDFSDRGTREHDDPQDGVMSWPEAPRLAVVKLGALGDVVQAFPLVSALKTHRPNARVTWIVEARLADVPRLHPGVDDVITVDTRAWRAALRRGRWRSVWLELSGFVRAVAGRFDVAIDAQGLLKSGVAAWLTHAPVRVGFAAGDCRERGNAWFMTRYAGRAGAVHALVKNRGLLTALGVPAGEPRFEIDLPKTDEAWAATWAEKHVNGSSGRIALLHPGAGHPGKRWPLDRWIALADRLTGPSLHAVLVAGPEDRAAVMATATALRRPAAVAAPPTVGALAALLRRAEVVIAGDTGPLHLAAALGRRTIALYGPSDPVTAAPVGTGHRVLKYPCTCGWVPAPTFNRRCAAGFACLQAITVEDVQQQLIAHRSSI